MPKLIIKPSVAFRISPSQDVSKMHLKIYYESGTRCLEILIPKKYSVHLEHLLHRGIQSKALTSNDTELPKDILKLAKELRKRGILISSIHDPNNWQDFYSRYDRQLRLISDNIPESISPIDIQQKLSRNRVAILGMGGMGTNILQQLAEIGIEHFLLVDPDVIELSNLNRQPIYSPEEIGLKKVDKAADWLKNFNNNIEVMSVPHMLKKAFQDYSVQNFNPDLIVNCADVPSVIDTTREIMDSIKTPIPILVGGGYFLFNSFVGPLILPGQTACLDCNISDLLNDIPHHIPAIGGNIAPVVTLGASLAALSIFKHLTGCGCGSSNLLNKQVVVDLDNLKIKERKLYKNDNCPTCAKFE